MKKVFLEQLYELLSDVAPCCFVPELGGKNKKETDKKVESIVNGLRLSHFAFD